MANVKPGFSLDFDRSPSKILDTFQSLFISGVTAFFNVDPAL
jgi:hypothetical protein